MMNASHYHHNSCLTAAAAADTKRPQTRLPDDFEPNDYTVLCGRGKEFFNYTGNRRFRVLVDMHLERYSLAETKSAKTRIVCEIVEWIRQSGGGFCKQLGDGGAWYDVGDAVAREKVGALFRDNLFNMYKSSSKAKTAVRKQRRTARCSSSKKQPSSSRCCGSSSNSSSSSNSTSSGSITDSMTESSSSSIDYYSSSSTNAEGTNYYGYDDQSCYSPAASTTEAAAVTFEPMNVKEVRFSLLEQDLRPLLYNIDFDLNDDDETVAAFDFVEI